MVCKKKVAAHGAAIVAEKNKAPSVSKGEFLC
jgi:hypothetical protein